jgi:hypothetical protein
MASLVQFFAGFGGVVFDEVRIIDGTYQTPGSVTGDTLARAIAAGQFEFERAEKIRDAFRARVLGQAERVEQLAAVAATK